MEALLSMRSWYVEASRCVFIPVAQRERFKELVAAIDRALGRIMGEHSN